MTPRKGCEIEDRSIETFQRKEWDKNGMEHSKCGTISKDKNTHNCNIRRKQKKAEEIFDVLNINGWEHNKLITNTNPVLQEAQETSY